MNISLPTTTIGAVSNPLEFSKKEIFKAIDIMSRHVSGNVDENQSLADSVLTKVDEATEENPSIDLTNAEVLLIKEGAKKFIASYMWKLKKECPELRDIIVNIRSAGD